MSSIVIPSAGSDRGQGIMRAGGRGGRRGTGACMDLVLMGLRGSGKTTLGQRLADRYELRFVDLDRRTPGEFGVRTVAEAWAKYGEAAFREAEVRALRKA